MNRLCNKLFALRFFGFSAVQVDSTSMIPGSESFMFFCLAFLRFTGGGVSMISSDMGYTENKVQALMEKKIEEPKGTIAELSLPRSTAFSFYTTST
jgi:hypothetical protein